MRWIVALLLALWFVVMLPGCQSVGGGEVERSVVEFSGAVDATWVALPVPIEGEVDVNGCIQELEFPRQKPAEPGTDPPLDGCFFFRGSHCWVSIGSNCPQININIFGPPARGGSAL